MSGDTAGVIISWSVIAYYIFKFFFKDSKNEKETADKTTVEPHSPKPSKKYTQPKTEETDPLKQKGDAYERAIGKQFEQKGDVVVYHGLIKGYEDQGVDIIVISEISQSITLVQCKNWTRRPMVLEDIEKVYEKLECYSLDFMSLAPHTINTYANQNYDEQKLATLFHHISQNTQAYTIRKALYVSSDKVIDLNIGKSLTMLKPNIFRYENMKIVVYGI